MKEFFNLEDQIDSVKDYLERKFKGEEVYWPYDISNIAIESVILSFETDEEKMNALYALPDGISRLGYKIIEVAKSFKSDEYRMEIIDKFSLGSDCISEIAQSMMSDDNKVKCVGMIAADDRMNAANIVHTIDSDDKKIEALKYFENNKEYFQYGSMLASLKSDDNKMKFVVEYPGLIERMDSDDKKIEAFKKCENGEYPLDYFRIYCIILSMKSEDKKTELLNLVKDDRKKFVLKYLEEYGISENTSSEKDTSDVEGKNELDLKNISLEDLEKFSQNLDDEIQVIETKISEEEEKERIRKEEEKKRAQLLEIINNKRALLKQKNAELDSLKSKEHTSDPQNEKQTEEQK